jgi:hypothetical protein
MFRSCSSPFDQIALEQQNSTSLAANRAEFLNIYMCMKHDKNDLQQESVNVVQHCFLHCLIVCLQSKTVQWNSLILASAQLYNKKIV